MKKLLLAITVLFTLLLGGCGEKLEPFEDRVHDDENGIVYILTGTKLNGEKHGKETYTNSDTNIVECIQEYKNGKFDGVNKHFDRNGNITYKGIYKDGKCLKEIIYDKNGNVIKETDYTKQ